MALPIAEDLDLDDLKGPFQSKPFYDSTILDFFLVSNLNLPSWSLKPFPLVLSPQAQLKSLSPFFLQFPFRH